MNEDQGPTRATRLLLWLLSMRPDVVTAVAAPEEAAQVHLENDSSGKAPGGHGFGCCADLQTLWVVSVGIHHHLADAPAARWRYQPYQKQPEY